MSETEPNEAPARRRLLLALCGCLGLAALPSACARDADGKVIQGAPPKPLSRVAVRVSEGRAIVGG